MTIFICHRMTGDFHEFAGAGRRSMALHQHDVVLLGFLAGVPYWMGLCGRYGNQKKPLATYLATYSRVGLLIGGYSKFLGLRQTLTDI
ncbi:hypothetical protein [Burkholderia gladioli]|uniref:hypothetical protein n=1 Tax=Burkholderia gladioli TaxID=28095 RepID=UPI0016415F94|nr:hypothetical protein [Burkholderia gladioli]